MSDLIGRWIPGLDPLAGTLTLPLWFTGAIAALFVVFCALALSRKGLAGGLVRITLVLLGVVLSWLWLEGTHRQNVAAERRALEDRIGALAARAMAPGSSLACLDAVAGDTVESACERALFATPEAAAAAVAYAAAQINLFAEVRNFVARGHSEMGSTLVGLRRAVEADRYGLVAHVLETRFGCTAAQCPALQLMRDPQRISTNLSQQTYQGHITRYAAAWPAAAPGATAAVPPSGPPGAPPPSLAGTSSAAAPGIRAPGPDVFFPSADSIPPVSIMTAEPAGEPETTASAPAPIPPRRPAQAPAQSKQGPVDLNSATRGNKKSAAQPQ
jgi:hypothetical protein